MPLIVVVWDTYQQTDIEKIRNKDISVRIVINHLLLTQILLHQVHKKNSVFGSNILNVW